MKPEGGSTSRTGKGADSGEDLPERPDDVDGPVPGGSEPGRRRPLDPPGTEHRVGSVARALARAEGMESVLGRIAEAARLLGSADGVFVERVEPEADHVVVAAGSGWGVPPIGTRIPFPGSLAEAVLEKNEPEYVNDLLAAAERPISQFLPGPCRGLILPLISEGEALGALVLLRRPEREAFDPGSAGDLRTLADLGALTLRRQIVLEGAAQHQELLESSERRFRLLLESVHDYAIFMLDPDGVVESWNRGAERIHGYSEAEAVGRHCSLFYPEGEGPAQRLETMLRRAEGGGRAQDEGWLERKDGTRVWAASVVRAVHDEDGRLVGFANVVHDLTERKGVDDALGLERRRLAGVLDALPVGVFISDAQGKIVQVNRAGREMWEGEAPLLEGPDEYDRYRAFRPGSDVPIASHEWGLARAMTEGETVLEQEVELETRKGRRRTLLNYAVPIRDARDEIVGGVAVNVDISEQRRVQEAAHFMSEASRVLAASLDYEETLRQVARLAVPRMADWCAIYVADETGELAVVEVAHADPERAEFARELLRRYPPRPGSSAGAHKVFRTGEVDFFPEISEELLRTLARDEEHLALLRETGLASAVVVPMIVRDRRIGAITLAAGSPARRFRDSDVRVARELADRAAVAVDNARLFREARRRAEEEEALRRAAHAVTASYSGAQVTREIAANALSATGADGAFVKEVDAESGDVVVTAVAGELVPPPGSRVPFETSLSRAVLRSQEPVQVERLADLDPRQLPGDLVERCPECAGLLVPLVDGGEVVGSLMLVREAHRGPFTEDERARARTFADLAALAFRKIHLFEDSERRREELEDVMESRARLMRGLTHDLRNPLAAADGMAALLEEGVLGELPPRAIEGVERLRRALGRATGLMDDLLEFARAAQGEITPEVTAVDLRDLAAEMFGEYRAQGESRGHEMHLSVPRQLATVRSDPNRVRQIVGNLISNAVKYTPPGGRIDVTVEERRRASEPWIVVEVEDDGPGIPDDQQEEVFREFTRLTPDAAEGSGLGLAVSRHLARALGGELTLESDPGRRTVFTLWLRSIPVGEGTALDT